MAMNTEYLSNDTTVFSKLSLSGAATLGAVETASAASFGAITGTTGDFSSTLSVDGETKTAHIGCAGLTASSTITLDDTAAPLSVLTNAADTDMTIGQLRLVFLSSGLSLLYSSGDTLYVVNSAQSEAQPTS